MAHSLQPVHRSDIDAGRSTRLLPEKRWVGCVVGEPIMKHRYAGRNHQSDIGVVRGHSAVPSDRPLPDLVDHRVKQRRRHAPEHGAVRQRPYLRPHKSTHSVCRFRATIRERVRIRMRVRVRVSLAGPCEAIRTARHGMARSDMSAQCRLTNERICRQTLYASDPAIRGTATMAGCCVVSHGCKSKPQIVPLRF